VAISPTSEELLRTYTEKLLSEFESRSAIVFYDLSIGLQNRITKEMRILTKYIWQIMNRVSALEIPHDQNQNVQDVSSGGSWVSSLPARRVGSRPRYPTRRSA